MASKKGPVKSAKASASGRKTASKKETVVSKAKPELASKKKAKAKAKAAPKAKAKAAPKAKAKAEPKAKAKAAPKAKAKAEPKTKAKAEPKTKAKAEPKAKAKAAPKAKAKAASKSKPTWHMRLYVAGDSPRSRVALKNLNQLCEERLKDDYEIEVIDLTKSPHLAKVDQILAVPTLVRSIPEPMKRIIGDLSNADRALIALDLDGQVAKSP